MPAFHTWFIPVVGLFLFRMIRKKQMKDAAVFLVLILVGYGLWLGVVSKRPLVVTDFIAMIIDGLKAWLVRG